jgi:hypothetical protein
MCDEGKHDQARHHRQVGDRRDESAPRDEPAIERTIDAKVEGGGEVHAADAEEDVEDEQRLRQRQQHGGGAGDEHGRAED